MHSNDDVSGLSPLSRGNAKKKQLTVQFQLLMLRIAAAAAAAEDN